MHHLHQSKQSRPCSPNLQLPNATDWISTTWLVSIASLSTISSTFNSLFKVLFIFPSRYLFAIGLSPIFSFRWNLPPTLGCNPKQPDSLKTYHIVACTQVKDGILTLFDTLFQRTYTQAATWKRFSRLQFGPVNQPDFKFELFPLHSPLLRESLLVSFPPLIDMLKFSG